MKREEKKADEFLGSTLSVKVLISFDPTTLGLIKFAQTPLSVQHHPTQG
jgi:hypothetical protein